LTHSVYLSTREAAVRLSIGASTLKKLRVIGGGPAFHRIGRRVVYSTEILDEWARQSTFESTSQYRSATRTGNRSRSVSALPAAISTPEVVSRHPSNPKSDGEIMPRGREHTDE
jgi:excisionase family DNA binding protein